MIELKEIDYALAEILLDHVLGKKGNLTYKEVAEKLEQNLGKKINPHGSLSAPLGNVSRLCFQLGLPLISAIVIYSGSTNADVVGKGFYPFACEFRPEYKSMSPREAWKQERSLIRECTEWDRLNAHLYGTSASKDLSSTIPVAKTDIQSNPPTYSDPFAHWLRQNTTLSDSSIYKYSRAVDTISREMNEYGVVSQSLRDMHSLELDVAIHSIMKNQQFIEKNIRGNHMYSNSLKQYRYYIHSDSAQMIDEADCRSFIKEEDIPETERSAIVLSRIGQGVFRKSLFEKYNGKCIITGIDHPKLLIASHIKPWAVSSNRERLSVDNGLLLSATYDRLFDNGLITFDPSGKIYLSSFISPENAKRLHLSNEMQFDLHCSGQMKEFLSYHGDVLFVK